jgi:SAM-dependent methyltransferase
MLKGVVVINFPPEFLTREALVLLITEQNDRILEIGPFNRPVFRGKNVKYFDILNRDGLVKRAKNINYPSDTVPEIDFVSSTGDLSVVNSTFDICFSSHCIEHQPDLIRHLSEVYRIIQNQGFYIMMIPDKRFCFDHFIPETTVSDVIEAIGRTSHTIGNVIRHRALVTHNDPLKHWKGDHGEPKGYQNVQSFKRAIIEFESANGSYIDVHAWQFTPSSFRLTIEILNKLGLINFSCYRVYSTPYGRLEFCAVLRAEKQLS